MKIFEGIYAREWMFVFITFFYILFNCFPLFADVTNIQVQSVCIFTTIALIILYPSALNTKSVIWFGVFVFVLLINALSGHYIHIGGLSNTALPAMWRITIEVAWVLPSLLIMSILLSRNKIQLYKIVGYGSLWLLIISFMFILPLLISYSNILRAAAVENSLEFTKPIGLPDYTLMHSYILMLPGICLYAKTHHGARKFWAIICAILFFYIITQTAVSTSITLASLFLLFAFFYNTEKRLKTVLTFFVLAVLFIVAYQEGLILAFVDWLMPFFKGTAVSFKLQDLHDSIVGGAIQGGSFDTRAELHSLSINSFIHDPVLGGGVTGGHSTILDLLGSIGLIGFIPFCMVLWYIIKRYTKMLPSGIYRNFMFSLFAIVAVYLYHKGIFGATGWLFMSVIGPCLILAVKSNYADNQ